MVGIVKSAFKKAVGRRLQTFDQLITLITEIEAVVNCRPLSYVSAYVNSPLILKPMDFLQSTGSVGGPDFDEDEDDPEYKPKLDSSDKLLQFWKTSQVELDKFWKLWQDDYLLALRNRPNFLKDSGSGQPKTDDVVIVHEEMVPRGSWKLGRIQKLNQSRGGSIRSADVLMPNKSVISRPVDKLYPIEVASLLEKPKLEQPEKGSATEEGPGKQVTSSPVNIQV